MPLPGAVLSCFAKKVPKEGDIGEGLSVRSRAQTAPPLCTPPAHRRQVNILFRVFRAYYNRKITYKFTLAGK